MPISPTVIVVTAGPRKGAAAPSKTWPKESQASRPEGEDKRRHDAPGLRGATSDHFADVQRPCMVAIPRKDFAGKRFESTAVAGVSLAWTAARSGTVQGLNSGVGYLVGAVTAVASRSQYFWVGTSHQRYAESGHLRPDSLCYTAVYGYRPRSWRTDYPRWDWRIFGEFTGVRAGTLQRQNHRTFQSGPQKTI